jgi:acetyl esterase/lipase
MAAHTFWQYVRLKIIVTLLRFINQLATRPHFKPSSTCNRKLVRIPSRDLNRFIDAWIYYPPNHTDGDKRGLVINWHGGGCMLPNLGMDHEFCDRVAVEGNSLVLDADYRKAPDDPFPAAIEDAEDTLRWVERQSHLFDLNRIALSGFSSGGNLALVASSELRREFKNINIKAVYSFYPGVDFTIPPEEKIVANPIRPLPFWFQRLISEAYLPTVGDRKSPRASPMYADTVSFPTCVMLFTCSGDILTPETEAFGEKLVRGGIGVEVVRVQGAHAFDKTTSRRLFNPEARDMAYSKVSMSLKRVFRV